MSTEGSVQSSVHWVHLARACHALDPPSRAICIPRALHAPCAPVVPQAVREVISTVKDAPELVARDTIVRDTEEKGAWPVATAHAIAALPPDRLPVQCYHFEDWLRTMVQKASGLQRSALGHAQGREGLGFHAMEGRLVYNCPRKRNRHTAVA